MYTPISETPTVVLIDLNDPTSTGTSANLIDVKNRTADGTFDNCGVISRNILVCPLCNSNGPLLHKDLQDHLFGAPGNWGIRKCANSSCGAAWADPQPIASSLGLVYQNYYTHEAPSVSTVKPNDVTPLAPLQGINLWLDRILFWKRPMFRNRLFYLEGVEPGSLLEVGCGSGEFLAEAKVAGWEVTGLDFDENAAKVARDRTDRPVHCGDLLDWDCPPRSFDAIVLNNVIEHLFLPNETIARCYELLRDGGQLIVSTPNIDSLGHKLFGRDWRGLESPRHLHLFNGPSLKTLAVGKGFSSAKVFSSPGIARFMFEVSCKLATDAGRTPPEFNPKVVILKERLLELFGISRGEWIVLIAQR
jgi:2-polyprenyl-3-methyl-5-hydroxy-6-metoxy-1,4-benzoquinol methylase